MLVKVKVSEVKDEVGVRTASQLVGLHCVDDVLFSLSAAHSPDTKTSCRLPSLPFAVSVQYVVFTASCSMILISRVFWSNRRSMGVVAWKGLYVFFTYFVIFLDPRGILLRFFYIQYTISVYGPYIWL